MMGWIKLSFFHGLIWIVFYCYFISPIKIELSNALLTEKQLRQELHKKEHVSQPHLPKKIYIVNMNKEELIKYFIHKSHFLVEEIYPTQIQKHKSLIKISFKVIFAGNIFQLKKWIDQLMEDKYLMNIDEILVNKNKFILKVDIFNVNDEITVSKNPEVLQWIGYTEKNNVINGLLRWENGDVFEVGVGSVIRKNLKILKITKEQMLIQENHRVLIVKYGKPLEI